MQSTTHRLKVRSGAVLCVLAMAALWLAGAAIGSHGAQEQSICIRSKQPNGAVVTQSLAVGDPTGLHCGQWICNAPVVDGVFTSPNPCVSPPLTINITSGTTVGVKPITIAAGSDWTLTVYLKDRDTNDVYGPFTWEDGADATIQRTQQASSHWQVHNMAVSGDGSGAFELWFGDPL